MPQYVALSCRGIASAQTEAEAGKQLAIFAFYTLKKNESVSDQTKCHKREYLLKFDLIRHEVQSGASPRAQKDES